MISIRIFFGIIFLIFQFQYIHTAKCTFYGSSGQTGGGETTASGETFNPIALTCTALPNVPMGKVLRVTNQRNGKSITVRVNDRFAAPPSEDALDLTYGAFGLLDDHEHGEIPCSYEII